MHGSTRTHMEIVITYCKVPFHVAEAHWPFVGRLRRVIRFGMVGVSGILVNSAVLTLCVWETAMPIWIASVLATEVAILWNFALNDRWTFRAERHHRPLLQRLLRFNGVALGGMGITVLLLTFLTTVWSLPLLVANLLAISVATMWNYLVNSWWTWRAPRSSASGGAVLQRDTSQGFHEEREK